MRDRGAERRQAMTAGLILWYSLALTAGFFGGAVYVLAHFIVKFW
jgi:hypothetical protein